MVRHFIPKKIIHWVWAPVGDPNLNQNELGFGFRIKFYTFWYRNLKTFRIFDTLKFLGLKNVKKFLENFFKEFSKKSKVFRLKHFWLSRILNVC